MIKTRSNICNDLINSTIISKIFLAKKKAPTIVEAHIGRDVYFNT